MAGLKPGKQVLLRSGFGVGSQGQCRLLKFLIRTEGFLDKIFEVGQAERDEDEAEYPEQPPDPHEIDAGAGAHPYRNGEVDQTMGQQTPGMVGAAEMAIAEILQRGGIAHDLAKVFVGGVEPGLLDFAEFDSGVGLTQESLFHGVYHLPQSLNVHPIQEHKNLGETNGLRLSLVVIADEAADDGNEGKDGEAKTDEGEGARKHKKLIH